MKDYSQHVISSDSSIKEALRKITELTAKSARTLFVCSENNVLVGTLTDGDIRRALAADFKLEDSVDGVMRKEYRYLKANAYSPKDIKAIRNQEVKLLPILDEQKVIKGVIDLNNKISLLPVDAVIIAGGEGRRLLPLTLDKPKPMLKVGDKPIIEHNIDRLANYGIENVYLSVKYLKERIMDYFGDGQSKSINIKYIVEEKPLGTIHSVSLVDNYEQDYILVMNSDLLTTIDFEDFFITFKEENADMAVASIPYKYKVPYGILEVENHRVFSFKEKPTYTHYSNAGIYLIKKELLSFFPKDEVFNATDLMERVVAENLKLISYPILGYWLDIGRHEEYEKAQEDIKHLKM